MEIVRIPIKELKTLNKRSYYGLLKNVLTMIDSLMNFSIGKDYEENRKEIIFDEDVLGFVRVGFTGDDSYFWATYYKERDCLSYKGKSRTDFHKNFNGNINSPWTLYKKIITGIEKDLLSKNEKKLKSIWAGDICIKTSDIKIIE